MCVFGELNCTIDSQTCPQVLPRSLNSQIVRLSPQTMVNDSFEVPKPNKPCVLSGLNLFEPPLCSCGASRRTGLYASPTRSPSLVPRFALRAAEQAGEGSLRSRAPVQAEEPCEPHFNLHPLGGHSRRSCVGSRCEK